MSKQPLKGLILKVCSRCNLDCTYCYMYSQGDMSFLKQPKFISSDVIDQLCRRLTDYFTRNRPESFELILHGGEPTLLGTGAFDQLLTRISSETNSLVKLNYAVQSNGILLNDDWIKVFRKHQVGLGISVDGPKHVNDLHRKDHKGNGSFDAVMKGLAVCNRHHYPFGLLGVQNPQTAPDELYAFSKKAGATNIDFLFPHHHHDKKPQQTGYADWWISLFDIWFYDNDDSKPNIRFLTQVIVNCLGLGQGFDMLGQQTNDYLVVETDGSIETVDAMKICGDGFTKENYHLQTHNFEQAMQSPLMHIYHNGHHNLSALCQNCPMVSVCGGGFLPHRFSRELQFDNPSVYCSDLKRIIHYIQHALIDYLSDEAVLQAGLQKFEVFAD
ncbi:MAG TPA: radical SAM protein [Dyadobacter sp.]|nr:radical SAM protein [Dyadobacter sp.]